MVERSCSSNDLILRSPRSGRLEGLDARRKAGARQFARKSASALVGVALAIGRVVDASADSAAAEPKKQYWARACPARWTTRFCRVSMTPSRMARSAGLESIPDCRSPLKAGINLLILYHVGGNCYDGADCDRFPSSEATGDSLGQGALIHLEDPATRTIVVDDLVARCSKGDELAPEGFPSSVSISTMSTG